MRNEQRIGPFKIIFYIEKVEICFQPFSILEVKEKQLSDMPLPPTFLMKNQSKETWKKVIGQLKK